MGDCERRLGREGGGKRREVAQCSSREHMKRISAERVEKTKGGAGVGQGTVLLAFSEWKGGQKGTGRGDCGGELLKGPGEKVGGNVKEMPRAENVKKKEHIGVILPCSEEKVRESLGREKGESISLRGRVKGGKLLTWYLYEQTSWLFPNTWEGEVT